MAEIRVNTEELRRNSHSLNEAGKAVEAAASRVEAASHAGGRYGGQLDGRLRGIAARAHSQGWRIGLESADLARVLVSRAEAFERANQASGDVMLRLAGAVPSLGNQSPILVAFSRLKSLGLEKANAILAFAGLSSGSLTWVTSSSLLKSLPSPTGRQTQVDALSRAISGTIHMTVERIPDYGPIGFVKGGGAAAWGMVEGTVALARWSWDRSLLNPQNRFNPFRVATLYQQDFQTLQRMDWGKLPQTYFEPISADWNSGRRAKALGRATAEIVTLLPVLSVTKAGKVGGIGKVVRAEEALEPSRIVGRTVLTFGEKPAAKSALAGTKYEKEVRHFFGGAGKSQDFKVTDLGDGQYMLEFFAPARTPGYGKRYVAELGSDGQLLREYKETIGPNGVIETKWVHKGSE